MTAQPRESTPSSTESSPILSLAITFVPIAFLLVLCVPLVRVLRRSIATQSRGLEHMDRMEAKTDRMVALLEEIRDRSG